MVTLIQRGSPANRTGQVGPIPDWPSRRLFVAPGRGWRDVITQLRREVANGPGNAQLVELARRISRRPLAGKLFPSTCMFNLVVSDSPDFHSVNGLLHICYKSTRRQFWFHHIGLDEQQQYLACTHEAALRTFSSLVQAKFRIGSLLLTLPRPSGPGLQDSRTFLGDRHRSAVFPSKTHHQKHS